LNERAVHREAAAKATEQGRLLLKQFTKRLNSPTKPGKGEGPQLVYFYALPLIEADPAHRLNNFGVDAPRDGANLL
jgi:hypothetical protein